ncbi:MAG TPA: SCO family protein, partial [Candidatus Baltobacteraceae bacterium]|nr:SCO family protein [Candidatus Baltobacteraceae bacterium]
MLHALLAAVALSLFPVHGVVLDTLPDGSAIVRTNVVPGILPSMTRRYRLDPAVRLSGGVGVDGFVDRSHIPWTLREPAIAGPFAPGAPDSGRVIPVDIGSRLPDAQLVDQNGRLLRLASAFAGKTVLLSFVFTRCPDRTLCPAISGKYAYMQSRLDPKRFALVEITLDPPYDSPAILRDYAHQYGAKPVIWT